MRLLVLSFYYPPDLSAGSFRTAALVEALRSVRPEGLAVDIITTQPNRYQSLADKAPAFEDHGWLTIRRLPLPAHRSGAVDQARAFMAFAPAVLREIRGGDWDVVFATSSRLMTAALGAEASRRLSARLYLDIRDLFADTMGDLLAATPLRMLLPAFRLLERRTLCAADRINLVSAGFLEHARSVAPKARYSVFTNGVDETFMETDFGRPSAASGSPLVVYAGNIGDGQGLHGILPQAAALMPRVRFRVVGDGGRRQELLAAIEAHGVSNIDVRPPVHRDRLVEHYREADMLFLHLNDHAAFRKVLPSKLFEYAATGKPVLAGVSGYAAEFLRQNVPDAAVFAPRDVAGMVQAFGELRKFDRPPDRTAFKRTFARRAIMERMAGDLLGIAGDR